MDEANKVFCSILLRDSRAEAKRKKIKIPKLSTWRSDLGNNTYFEVYASSKLIWSGRAYNASEAKAKAINEYIYVAEQDKEDYDET